MPSHPPPSSADAGTGRSPGVGDPSPAISVLQTSGERVSLCDFRGEPVILAFFGSHWEPARTEHLARYRELLEELLLSQSTITDDSETGIPLVTVHPDDRETAHRFGVSGEQAVFVLGSDGTVRWKYAAPYGVYPRPEAVRDALAAAVQVPQNTGPARINLSRRDFLATALGAALLLVIPRPTPAEAAQPDRQNPTPSATVPVTLTVNGKKETLNLEPRVTLLDALREYMGLTGSKKGCDHGQCGACTVHVAGRRINSCLTLAVMQQNQPITTIEGLADGERLHPMQEAFIKHDGFQCGYCTPGQIMSACALITEGHAHSVADVREGMSGNICRCGAYPNIVAAVEEVRTARAALETGKGKRNEAV